MHTASASVDHFSESLIHIGRDPFDQLRPDAVDEIVRRVVRESDESTQVEVAAFNSSI